MTFCTLLLVIKDDKCIHCIKMSVNVLRHSLAYTRCNWGKLDMDMLPMYPFKYDHPGHVLIEAGEHQLLVILVLQFSESKHTHVT